MPVINHLIGIGTPTGMATAITGGPVAAGITAAGSTQGTATLISTGTVFVSIVSSSGKGVQLMACDPNSSVFVYNGGSNTCHVYGQTGEAIAGGAANALFAVGTKKGALFTKVSATQWGQVLSA